MNLEHFGINGNLIATAKEDGGDLLDNFIAGEPASFQKELLQGIGFLQERIQRSEHNPDSITVVSYICRILAYSIPCHAILLEDII